MHKLTHIFHKRKFRPLHTRTYSVIYENKETGIEERKTVEALNRASAKIEFAKENCNVGKIIQVI